MPGKTVGNFHLSITSIPDWLPDDNKNQNHKIMKTGKLLELKELDKQAAKITRKRDRLEAQLKAEKEAAAKYDDLLKQSGYKRPKDFIKALMAHLGIRSVDLTGAKRGPGRPPATGRVGRPPKAAKVGRPAKKTGKVGRPRKVAKVATPTPAKKATRKRAAKKAGAAKAE